MPPPSGSRNPNARDGAPSQFRLVEGAVLCACPDCQSLMSVRIWLGVADCWNCGSSVELSEEQEREVERLLAARPPRPSAPAVPATARMATVPGPGGSEPRRATAQAIPATAELAAAGAPGRSRPSGPHAPVPAPARSRRSLGMVSRAALRRRFHRHWLREWLRDMPAWLVSLVLHTVLLLLLGLLNIYEDVDVPFITLSTSISREKAEGEYTIQVDEKDEVAFNLPVPDNVDLKNKAAREALIQANQDARELQIDPDVPAPQMAPIGEIRELASSEDPVRRALAVRDPRLRVEVVKREGGTTLTEAAVSRGLRWLAQQQQRDGRWTNGNAAYDTANTALALLPFLGAGQTPAVGTYRDHVSRGLRWLRTRQNPDGDLRGGTGQHPGMYAHGIASIVLCDAFALTGDEALRDPAQRAIAFIVAAQNNAGGWRYMPRQDADLSVVGWQLMALQSARMARLSVPTETLELADQYLDSVSHEERSLYSYQRHGGETRPTPTMTAEGLLCRMYLGWRRDTPGLTRGVEWLAKNHLPDRRQPNIYYWYYGTQVFHHYGGSEWDAWNSKMRDILVETQVIQGPHAGSWHPESDRWGSSGGRIFVTSLSVCALEVYYRHAPIYRQLKLD